MLSSRYNRSTEVKKRVGFLPLSRERVDDVESELPEGSAERRDEDALLLWRGCHRDDRVGVRWKNLRKPMSEQCEHSREGRENEDLRGGSV